ncbi:alpha/beta hydrolase family protein, partial [Pseudomonas sp. RIT-PI-AD]|uniref:alpha/beta hydrolase family protein n=1 Tax=Pseudomonas sp. RIT-PI-AD TaxID=3035294 RepID=UPI0021DB756B
TPPIDLDALRKAHAERVLARLDAAVAFAKSRQATRTVLLGHGSGAYWAARYLGERKPAGLTDLLLVAAATPPGFAPVLEDFVVDPKLAIGDFYYKDVPTDRDSALKRMQTSKREKHPVYVQVALKALPGNRDIEQEQLFRRIKGWLNPTPQAPGQP